MVTKTITITEEAYKSISRLKLPDESFSDLFKRLSRNKQFLWRFYGIWSDERAEEAHRKIREHREKVTKDMEGRYARLRQLSDSRDRTKK